jgi:hypothetical protein
MEFVSLGASNACEAAIVDEFDPDEEDNGRKDGTWQKAQWMGQKQQYREYDGCSRKVRPLTTATGSVYNGGLCRAAIDDEGVAKARCSVGKSKTYQVLILIKAIVITEGVSSRSGSALRKDDDETRDGDWQHHH